MKKNTKIEYFAPLSSHKPKHIKMHNTIDFFKIDNGELGCINFNNMIPVTRNNYEIIDLNKSNNDLKYYNMLNKQYLWLNKNYIEINTRSFNLYTLYNNNKLSDNIKNRYCNFKLLEEKCIEYNNELMKI